MLTYKDGIYTADVESGKITVTKEEIIDLYIKMIETEDEFEDTTK